MTEGRVETESRCQECLAIIKGEITSNDLSKRRVRSRTHGVVGGRGLVAPSYPIIIMRFYRYIISERMPKGLTVREILPSTMGSSSFTPSRTLQRQTLFTPSGRVK